MTALPHGPAQQTLLQTENTESGERSKNQHPFSNAGLEQLRVPRNAPPAHTARCRGRAAAISARRGRSWAAPGHAMAAAKAGALPEAAERLKRFVAAEPSARLESVRALTGLFREAQPR